MTEFKKNTHVLHKALLSHNLKSDWIMLLLIGLHWFIAAAITAVQYDTYQLGLFGGGLYFLITLIAYRLYKGKKEFRIIVGIVLMLFSMLYIQQHLGRIEMHFHVFIAISFLTIYKDMHALIAAVITTSIYHLLFNYMQMHQMMLFSEPVYIFNYGCGYDIALMHILFVLFEGLVIFYFINISKKDFTALVTAQKNYQDIANNLEKIVHSRTAELTKLNSIFEEAQQITHLGNWEWNILDGSLQWSDEIYRIFGVEPKSFLPTYEKFTSFVHPDDRAYINDHIDLALKNIGPYNVIHRVITPDNEYKYVHERGHVDRDAEGHPVRMIGTVQDITSEIAIQSELKKSEDKFKILTEHSYTGILVHEGNILYTNPKLEEMTGYNQEELLNLDFFTLFPELNNKETLNILKRRTQGEKFTQQYEDIQMSCKDGSSRLVSAFSVTIEYEGRFVALSNVFDMTDIRKAEEQAKTLSLVVEQTDDIIKITDTKGIISYVNDAFIAHTGYARHEAIGKRSNLLKSDKHAAEFFANLWKTIQQGLIFKDVLINRKKDGSIYYEAQTIAPIINSAHEITGYFSTGKDITQHIKLEEKLSQLASTDSLTGINNRRHFEELLTKEIARTKRNNNSLALMMFDIDHFKQINDTYGHNVGDNVLQSIANVILFNIRETDVFARWGGEEFILFFPETNEESAEYLGEKLRHAVEHYDFNDVDKVTASFGITLYKQGETSEELIKRADEAMYQAKSAGRNRVIKLL